MKPLEDWEKALLLLYVQQDGLPPWADNQHEPVLAALCGWTEERAVAAFKEAEQRGTVDNGESHN